MNQNLTNIMILVTIFKIWLQTRHAAAASPEVVDSNFESLAKIHPKSPLKPDPIRLDHHFRH